jgi:spermidine/putrescine transport system substrate-binding protein
MHPRQSWVEPGVRRRTEGSAISRREFLGKVGSGAALGALLAACGSSSGSPSSGGQSGAVPLARPDHPVRWPIFPGNRPIASGLQPEKNATLQIYNWVAYLNESLVKDFCRKYKCSYSLTTFDTMQDATAKLATGELKFDVFFPTLDVLGGLIDTKMLRPLNHSYIPNIANTWPGYRDPFYDLGWQYTVPYTIWTTGMAWRKDKVPLAPSWAMPWQGAAYKGRVAVLDSYREVIVLALLKNGVFSVNSGNSAQLQAAASALQELSKLTDVRIDNNDYTEIPDGNTWIHEAWSGDIAAAPYYMPKNKVHFVGYWYPPNGKGPVGNDCICVMANAAHPVLAHLFLNYMLDNANAFDNYSYTAYMQPLTAMTPQRLVAEGLLPESLTSTVVLPSYFNRGQIELELSPSVNAEWLQIWDQFSKGL